MRSTGILLALLALSCSGGGNTSDKDQPSVGDVRGAGYFWAIELVKDKATKETFDDDESERLLRGFLSKALVDAGLYCRADDRGDPVVQLAPPLISGQAEFDEIEQILRSVLTEAWSLNGSVALRPEPFGALLYHFGTRKLSFLKNLTVVGIVQSLADHDSAEAALLAAGISPAQRPLYLQALTALAALVALGLGFYMLHASIQVYVTEFAPAARSSAVAFHTFSFFVGGGISPVLYGGGLDRLGPGMTLSIAAVAMVLIGIVSAQLLVKPRPT